ncbi:MAG TPA: hypothetical protein VG095_02595 [Chthoniobacterales bacterium]|nr:hypothetical protein [Chthoniobacterales bacterium]
MSFIRTGFREVGLKVRRQKTRMALRHERRVLQRAEIALGREGVNQAGNFPELRNEIVALKKLEQEQKEVALRITQIEAALKEIEAQRQQNAKEQAAALAALEEEKKPILQRHKEARATADLCDRELSGVERRLQDNDTADRELLQKISELQAQVPPPEDFDAQMAGLSSRRSQLPDQRAEIVRARLGAADACRQAKEKLAEQQAALDEIDKRIARVRSEFEAREKALNESARGQHDALKEARTHHQTVEERKNPAYLNIGRHLATQGIAPPNAPHLLETVQRHRAAVERHTQHREELAVLSSQIDKQELRKFYFSIVSVLVIVAIIIPLILRAPKRREWLPHETEAILSVNTQQLQRDELARRWEKERSEEWQTIWSGLTANAQQTPMLNLPRDAVRVTRGLASDGNGGVREFVLVQAKGDVANVIRSIEREQGFERRAVSGLPVWLREDFALARVGPRTLAVGAPSEVEELVRVRLGIEQDLKITGSLFDRFQALDQETALRLISSNPPSLARYFDPIFPRELLESAQIVGLGLTFGNPVRARVVIKMRSARAADDLAKRIRDEPQRWLRLQDSDLLLYGQAPEVITQETDLELRFIVPENSARLLLQRVAKTSAPPTMAGVEQ